MSEIQPLRLTMADLQNLVAICDNEIRLVEFANTTFGIENPVQMRAIASNIQARLQTEIMRQDQLAESRRVEEERKKQAEKNPVIASSPLEPVKT